MAEDSGLTLPSAPIDRFAKPLERFLHIEAAGGVVLLVSALFALVIANSPASDWYLAIWKTTVSFGWGDFQMSHSLKHWINDGLMVIFFFVMGLEVKRELVLGELRDLRRAALPIAGAIGGMVVPACIYLAIAGGSDAARGWGIPMATDIAFVVGCLAVLGSRVPPSLRVMLVSLAIADDIGAILVIAFGYTEQVYVGWLLFGLAMVGLTVALGWLGVRSVGVYMVVGGFVWLGFHESGVHATIAGVILGLATPAHSWAQEGLVADLVTRASTIVTGGGWISSQQRLRTLREVEIAAREALSPLERLENTLHPWASFAIVPIFALANAAVPISSGSEFPVGVALAVAAGLVVGKPIGILLISWLAVRARVAVMPEGVTWAAIAGAGCLAGIGFTMSLFIGGLALAGANLEAAKLGILGGSMVAAVLGMTLLVKVLPKAS